MRILHKIITFTFLVTLVGCECDYNIDIYTRIINLNQVDVLVEFRATESINSDGSINYKIFNEIIESNRSADVYLRTVKEEDKINRLNEILSICTDGASFDHTVQFSTDTLSTYTICDTEDTFEGSGIVPRRYQIKSLGDNCEPSRRLSISDGYN